MFSVRLVTADSYQAQPLPQLDPTFSEFRGSEIKHVPVIRIFGTTPNGEKTCMHVHGVFPYLFVPYTGEEDPGILAYRLAASLDAAINVSLGSATSNTQHVYSIQRVSGTPFYGYHRKEHQFLKIYFYNPAMIKRAADLLQNGSVLNQSLQPHESHINYILQFMMDYNIYGMSLVNLRCVKHRRVAQTLADLASSGQSLSSENSEIVYLPMDIERQSTCELETDALATDILNRLDVEHDLELNPGLAAIWEEERARRAQAGFQGGDSQLVNPKSPARPTFCPTDNDIYQEQRLARRLSTISQCDESTLSTTSNRSVAYAAEVREGENLLNSSRLPNISVQRVERIHHVDQDDSLGNMSFINSPMIPASQNMTPDCSILGTDDMPLVDLLAQLARDNEENTETVDTDSLLGSQVSRLLNDNDKSDNEDDDDIADLNLTSLQLDSLGSLETAMNLVEKSVAIENLSDTLNVSPFLSPYEISSCSSKTSKDNDTTSRDKDNSRDCRIPQYDGAGDVSPTLMNSDNEDVHENANNAKDLNHCPEYNDTFVITSETRQREKLDKSIKITSRKNSSMTNASSDITIEYESSSRNNEFFCNTYEHDCNDVTTEVTPSTLTNEQQFGQYGAIGYEPFDPLLEIGTDFVPDFVDMQSSMEIGILLSSGDTEKDESVGEIIDQEIPIETVLNGDPCFTESAELDKSDLTELRDQYASLLGNALLPDIHNNPRTDDDLGDSSTFNETNFTTIEKTCDISSSVKSPRAPITSRDSSSSLENVTPNIQEPENRGFAKAKLNSPNDVRDSQSCKDIARVTSDTADYNCNVVATWAELQNLQIVDKTDSNARLSRTRTDNGKYMPGPRSMKRRGIRRTSPDKVASQVFRNNTEKIPLRVSNNCLVSPSKLLRSSVSKSPTKRQGYISSSACGTEKSPAETRKKSDISGKDGEERLSCGPLPNVPRYQQSSGEDSSEQDFPSLRTTASLDAFHRSIIGSDNPLADIRNTLPGAKYSAYPLNDNPVEPILADFQETSENNCLDDFDESPDIEGEDSHGISYYSSQRSDNQFELENRRHRHYVLSRINKYGSEQAFTSDQLWLIQKRKRGGNHAIFRPFSSVCERQDCPLPVVLLKKIEQRNDEDIVVVSRNDGESIDEDLPCETSNENVKIPENPDSRISSIETCEKNVELPQQQRLPRVRKTRKKSELSLLTSNAMLLNVPEYVDESIIDDPTQSNVTVSRDLPVNEIRCERDQCRSTEQIMRDPYNTRRRSIGQNFAKLYRRNGRIPIENGDKDKREMKKPRARTKYKDGNLPGIPGIVNYEIPKQRRRSRKIIVSSNNVNTGDSASEEFSIPKKHLSSKLFPNWGAQRETEKYIPNGIVQKSPINGLVLKSHNSEILPDKRKGRSIKANFPISPIPKRNTSLPDDKRDLSSKFLNFSSTPEKNDKARQSETNKIHVSTKQKKLPETVALGLLLQEAKSRSTRTTLKLLLRKRLNDKFTCERIETEAPIKKIHSNGRKTREKKVVPTAITMEKSILPPIPIIPEVTRNRSNDEESCNVEEDENILNNSINSDPPSFETVTDLSSDAMSDTNCDSIAIASLDNVEEICNHSEFDGSALSVEFCNSVDDGTDEIFDNETADNSVITETTNVEEFPNSAKLSYDTDRYENAIKEANFFAGKDYTIDAVSNEIPTCLFEEDSNSIDKRIPKRVCCNNLENFNDSCGNVDIDTSSELSIDPRDLDVYDVESLTPSSSFSIPDESIDVAELPLEISELDDRNVIARKKMTESIDEGEKLLVERASTSVISREEIVPEHESSFEEDSPSFEALSPEPRVCSLVGKSLEDEFNAHSRSEVTKDSAKCKKIATRINDPTIATNEKLSIAIVKPKNTGDENILVLIDDSSIMRNKNSSITIENSPSKNTSITDENLPIEANKESSMAIDSIAIDDSCDAIQTKRAIEDDGAKLDNEIKELVSQVVIEFKNELEITEIVENNAEAVSIIDIKIQVHSDAETGLATGIEREKEASASIAKDNQVLINTKSEIDALEIVENDEIFSASSERDEALLINTAREKDASDIVEMDDKVSTSIEKELETRIFVENDENLCASIEKESEMRITAEEETDRVASTEKESEMQTSVETEKDLSASTEIESEMKISVEKENTLLTSTEKEYEMRISVVNEDGSLANTEKESEMEISVEEDNKLLTNTEKETEIPEISVEEEKEILPSTETEIQSSRIVETIVKLSKNIEIESEMRKTCENENDLSASTEMEIESSKMVEENEKRTNSGENKLKPLTTRETEKELSSHVQTETESSTSVNDLKLSEDSENDSELLVTCEKEKELPASVQTETKSPMSAENQKLLKSNGNESEEPMTFEKEKDLSSSTDKESETQISVEEQKKLLTSIQVEIPSPTIVERDEKLFESNDKESERLTTLKKEKDISASTEKESEIQIPVEAERELLAIFPMEICSPTIVENDEKLIESSVKELERPMTFDNGKDISASTENKAEIQIIVEAKMELLANSPMKIQSPTIVENNNELAESSEEESESLMTRKKLKGFSSSTKKESKIPVSIEKEKELLANPPMEIQSPTIVENNDEPAESIEEESEPPMTRKKSKDLSSSTEKESKIPLSIEKEKELLAKPPTEIQSPTIVENNDEPAESIEEESEPPMTRKKFKDLSSSTEKESKILLTIEQEKELLANPPMEIKSPTIVENNNELAGSSEKESQPLMSRKKFKDLFSSNEKESKIPIFIEKEKKLLANPPMEIQSPTIVEKGDKLPQSSENQSELSIIFSSDIEKESKIDASVEEEKQLLASNQMEIQSSTIVEKDDKLPESREKESELPVLCENKKELSAVNSMETEASTIVEKYDKIAKSREKESEVPVLCEKENELSEIDSMETEVSTIIEKNEELLEITEKETKLRISAVRKELKSNKSVQSPIKLPITPNVDIDVRANTKRQKDSLADDKNKNEQPKKNAIDEKEPKIDIKKKLSLPKALRKKKIESITENEETEKKNHASKFKIIARVNQTYDNMENESVDINKNDVVVSILETENRESNEAQVENISKETKSLINHDNFAGEAPKKLVECRPVSIKLVNIDLSKIRYFTPKNVYKSKIQEPASSQVLPQDNEKETLHEKVAARAESSKNSDENTDNRTTIEKSIGEVNSLTVTDVEKLTTMEAQSSLDKKSRKPRKKVPKDMRMPERRSVRICAEMTLKLSQQESLTKISSETESPRDETTCDADKLESEPPLPRNTEEKNLQESEQSPIEIPKDDSQCKSLQTAPIVKSSMSENLRKINEYTTTTVSQLSQQESVEQETESNISQELVLSEQIVANKNSAPSTIMAQRRGRMRKSSQTNSQEVALSTKIIDENTAPIFDKPKGKNLQVNVQETFVDSKKFKQIPEDVAQKIVDKTLTVIDAKPVELELKIAENNVDAQTMMVSSKTARSANDRLCKIRNTPRNRKRSSSKSARSKKRREIMQISYDTKSSNEQNSTENTNQDLKLSMILPLPTRCTNIIASKNDVVMEKTDELSAEKSSLPEETVREIIEETRTEIDVTREKIGDDKIEPRISMIHKRRGRSEKKSETIAHNATGERKLSSEKSVDGIAEVRLGPELSPGKIIKEKAFGKSLVAHRRRGRSRKNPDVLISPSDSESGLIGSTRNIMGNVLPRTEILREKIAEESTESLKNSIVLKRRGRPGKSPEIKLDCKESDISPQHKTDTSIETETSVVPKRKDLSDKSPEKNTHKLSYEETSQVLTKEKFSQKPQLVIQKITEDSILSMMTVLPKRRGRSGVTFVVDSKKKLSPDEDSRSSVETKTREFTLVTRKIVEENDETRISLLPKRRGRSGDKQTVTEYVSSIQEDAINSQECKSALDEVAKETSVPFCMTLHGMKERTTKKGTTIEESLSHTGSSSNENISDWKDNCSVVTESLTRKIVDESIESRTLDVSVKRGRFAKLPETNFHEAPTLETTFNENSREIAKTTEETMPQRHSREMEKTLEDNTCPVQDSLTNELPVINTLPDNLAKPKKRVRFDEESIRRCQEYCRESESSTSEEEIFESSPRKHYKLSLINHSPSLPRANVSGTACEEISNDSSSSTSSESPEFESVLLSVRLEKLREEKIDNVINAKDNNVGQTAESTLSTSDKVSLDFSLLRNSTTRPRQLDKDQIDDIPRESELSVNKEGNLQINEKPLVAPAKWNDLQSSSLASEYNLSTISNCPSDRSKLFWRPDPQMIAYAQRQKPKIVLKRLSQNLLKSYGIVYRTRDKIFVKIPKKCNHDDENNDVNVDNDDDDDEDDDEEFQLPAYDGAADLSSSDNDEDQDVTIAREEKRVCSYNSLKKNTTPAKRDYVVSSKKRKLDIGDNAASGPSNKRQALATPKKTSYRSPIRTSMLKSPGRIAGNYSPLKIIVTSPKVRKDMLEPRISISLDKQDDNANASSSLSSLSSVTPLVATPGRKNSRLHDNMLRGRFNSVESSLCELGDKHATVAKMGSDGVGELDEIQSIGQTEHGTVNNVCATITSESHESSRFHGSTMIHRDGKDVRKKLVFSNKDSIDYTEEVSIMSSTKPHEETLKLQIFHEETEHLMIIDANKESIESPKNNRGTTMFDAVPGTSRGYVDADSKNRQIYEIRTEPESNDDDDDDDDDNNDVCNVTFTQYINSQINKNDPSSTLDPSVISAESKKKITIMPKFEPPSHQRVIETMETYGIPKCRNQEPFFSDPADVPKQKELAQRMLKVPGKDLKHLPPFVSSVEGVTGLARWRKMWLNEFHPSLAKSKDDAVKLALASNERVIITPLVKPPTQKQVRDWLRARRYLEKKRKEENEESRRKKLGVPKEIKIPIQAVGDEKDECLSNASDFSIVEPSPDRTLVSNDVEKTASTTSKGKFSKQELFDRGEEIASCKSWIEEGTKISRESSGSREKSPSTRDNTVMDPSLLDVLQKSRLFHDQEASRHLGITCGQIDFLSDSTRSNVANENLRNAKALTRYQYLTIMCLEVHVTTRGDLLPDAQHDAIDAIFYSVQSDVPPTSSIKPLEHGVIVVALTEKSKNKMYYSYSSNVPWTISFANNEEALLNSLVNLITRADPEILIGWELETLSWGYVFQRATRLGMNLSKRISRIPSTQWKWEIQAPDIETLAEVKLPGRIVLDIWRLMRHEAALLSYTFESVIHHVLNERISCPSFKILTDWWNIEKSRHSRWRVVEHYSIRVLGVLRILDQLDIIGRTSELARLFGIQFYEVFSRGSQFRVESVMLRLAKPLNYIAVSPSSLQRASMRAMEALPLIMEPESMFYSDPLIVLDFQSLYPSIIIAHNYCFSTCLGRIEHIGQPQPFEFGAYTLRVPKNTALRLQGKVNYAPCGVAYVKSEVRLGILPRMLTEILETRFMVKKAMKDHRKDDKTLQRALHSRQMGLKFLANVTYGYTAANFSGRMPCIEVGDSVISKSKETLERAIKLVETTPKWGARVVYGDTDSLFILVPGRSKADAFVIGNEIADAVTASNPPPIKLRFEKVLFPAILQTKKRYCGYMYESPEQEKPTYLAKGIETVRRDGCPAVSKILEKTLKILFETKDVSLVKKYVTRQLDKVLRGKVSIQDLTFAKEFRGFKGYKAKACVPALELTRRLMRKDPRAVPRNNERVRYVIVAGAPNQALIHCVRTPWELINDPGLRPNAIYYVTRVIIPPLNRCFNLMGVDVNAWYREMPHRQILDNPVGQPSDKQKLTIFQYFGTIVCVSCGQPSNRGICTKCLECPADTLVVMYEKLRWLDRTNNHVTAICQSCVGQADAADCASLDCPVLYRRAQAQRELTQAIQLREIIRCGNNLEF